ncbi:MAG TPA: NAD(P)H-dependent oxidoreductase [Pseudolabrys sp.]|nr:NAD(P)H-dependent oxidoreductase [Pseudolabrys sp.]
MPIPKILVIPGSLRTGSHNVRLAALMVKELTLADAEVTRISLTDYPLPLYDANLEVMSGVPENALKLKRMMVAHHGVFIASPEYNASVTPLLKNTIDWVSRARERGDEQYAAYKNRPFALGAASPGPFGGMRSLLTMRQVLEVGIGALVIPDMVSIANADRAFDEQDNLIDPRALGRVRTVADKLIEMARMMMGASV